MTAGIDFDPKRRDAIAARMNLSVLQRADPAVKRVLKLASHVCLYQLDDAQAWRRLDIEGSLFVVELHVDHPNNAAHARHRIVIINRKSLQNYSDDVVVGNKEIELQQQMIMYTNSKQHTVGIWFYQNAEASSLFQLLQALVQGREPSPPSSPPSQTASSASQSAPSAAASAAAAPPVVDAARPAAESSTRARRSQKRVSRNAPAAKNVVKPNREAANPLASASLGENTGRADRAPNSLERFFPALKHTHGVAGATLPPEVNTSSVMESVAVTTLTSNKHDGAEFKPTSEIDEAIVIASDSGIPDSILSNRSSSADQLVSDAMKIVRSRTDKKPRSDARRKSSPKVKPAPKVITPLKVQRPKRSHPVSKPVSSDVSAPTSSTTATPLPLYSAPSEPVPSVERRKRTSPPPQKSSPQRKAVPISRGAADVTSGDRPSAAVRADKIASEAAQSVSRAVHTARQEALAKRFEAPGSARSTPVATAKSNAVSAPSNEAKAHAAAASKPLSKGSDARQRSGEVNALPATASASLPALSVSRSMEEAQRHLQAMSMQQEGLNMGDPLVRNMAPFRFPTGSDMALAHSAGMMPSPLAAPPQSAGPFPAGIHPQMAMLMQHQLFLQQQQFLAQQEHQRRMQMQSMPIPSMPMMHKSEARSAANVPNGPNGPNAHVSSRTASAADSAAELMRMLNAGGAKAEAKTSEQLEMSEQEKGKHVARSVASADRKGELASSSSNKMDRSEFRAVVQRMLTDKRLFESVYASYVCASED